MTLVQDATINEPYAEVLTGKNLVGAGDYDLDLTRTAIVVVADRKIFLSFRSKTGGLLSAIRAAATGCAATIRPAK